MTDLAEPMQATSRTVRDLTQVAAVADNVVDLLRSFNRAKARMMKATEHDVEWSSHIILRCLKNEGAMRAGAVADSLQNDPSTVSRQVAALVKDGFLERQADPDDGRASLLVLTPKAESVLAEHDRIRVEFFGQLLHDWTDRELADFATQLERFTSAYEGADEYWIKRRLALRTDRTSRQPGDPPTHAAASSPHAAAPRQHAGSTER